MSRVHDKFFAHYVGHNPLMAAMRPCAIGSQSMINRATTRTRAGRSSGPGIGLKTDVLMGLLLLAAALLPLKAHAGLGGPESTVADDVALLQGSIKSTPRTLYQVHDIQLPSGTVLREFATVGGNVFAVSWSGPSMPNLRQALGNYFAAFVAAAKTKHGDRNHLHIEQPGLVIQSSGHMRAFTGRAYLPDAIPAGVAVEELH